MFVQSLAVMRQQKVIESGIKVPLCHLSPLLCQYNIFYSLSQLWSVHHSVTQSHTVPCTVSPQVGATYRECRSDKGFTVEPNTRPQHHSGLRRTKRGLNMSTSHKYKKETKKTSTKVKVRKDVFEHRQQYRETQTHTLDHSSPLSSLFPDTKMYVAMHCALITVTLTLRIISILPLPPLRYFFYLDKQWTLVQIYANSTNTPMDTCMSSIVKNSFKGLYTVQVQSLADSSQCC